MKRRKFLKITGIGTVTLVTCSYFYLNDERMERAPLRNGKVIADLHTHPANYKSDQETLEMLCSPGLVGLANINDKRANLLTYEQALKRFSGMVEEIDRGLLAKIKTPLGKAYFTRTQEITGGTHHILAVGFRGDYLPNYRDTRKAVEEVHKRNGIAILNHPYVTPNKDASVIKYRFITAKEENAIKELCEMVDEVEVFNAQCINPTLGIVVPNMKKANGRAEELVKNYGFKGTVSTDTHLRMDQPKMCGIYIDEDGLCIDKLKEDIKTGNFDNDHRQYVSRWSFAMGMFG